MKMQQKIIPHLWFDKQAKEAVDFYTSIFKNSKIGKISYYGKEGQEIHGMEPGDIMTIEFEIEGQKFIALNDGPTFKFTEAVSFMINCKDQKEVDYFWEKLSEGGDPKSQVCGWLKDKYGLSWQVIPEELSELLADKDSQKSGRTMEALLKMKKLDIEELKRAHDGK